ncbi:Retrovirus-related Pol polyprotein from transposon TNT 1-94 [Bienertia sinuspersici]
MSNNTIIDASSPLYLHPSDGSNTITVEELQGSTNYRTWKREMEVALSSKRKLGFVSGVVEKDKTDPVKIEAWTTCNDMVISWILRNVSDSIKKSIMFMGTAKDMWKNLEQRFQVNNGARRYQVCKQIYDTKQNGKSVSEYFTEMQMLWQELEDLTNYPPLTEMNAEVAAYVNFRMQQEEEQKLFQFLNGLDEVNGAIRTHILMQPRLPTASEACSTIQQEESQRENFKNVKEESEGLVMYGKGIDGSAGSSGTSCTVCGKQGHVKDNCWYVKGFPSGYKSNSYRGRGQDRGRSTRGFRGNRGGRYGRGGGNRDGVAVAANAEGSKEVYRQGSGTSSGGNSASITPQQVEQLLKLLPPPSKTGGEFEDDFDSNYAGMVVCCNSSFKSSKCILDTAATHHMCGDKEKLVDLENMTSDAKIDLPNGNKASVTHKGTVKLNNDLVLRNVMYVPSFNHNLVSVQRLIKENDCEVKFQANYCLIVRTTGKEVKGLGVAEQGLYMYVQDPAAYVREMTRKQGYDSHGKEIMKANRAVEVEVPDSIKVDTKMSEEMKWHHRLGHIPIERMKKIRVLQGKLNNSKEVCLVCPQAKFTKVPFNTSQSRAAEPFELIHIDAWGPYRTPTRKGHRYFLTMVDDYSRTTWVHLMKHKSEALGAIQELIQLGRNQFGKTVKVIRSDNALEYEDKRCIKYYAEMGITHQTTCVGRSQQNGRVERKHRNILEMARAIRLQVGLPIYMWGDCVLGAVYISNRLPCEVLHQKSPYEVMFNKIPDYNALRTFGCLVMAHNPMQNHDKFNERGVPCVFIGYPQDKKGYKVLNLLNNMVFVSRDVRFYEGIYPYKIFRSPKRELKHSVDNPVALSGEENDMNVESTVETNNMDETEINEINTAQDGEESQNEETEQIGDETNTVRQSVRVHRPPGWLKDYYTACSKANFNEKRAESSTKAYVSEPFRCFMSQLE